MLTSMSEETAKNVAVLVTCPGDRAPELARAVVAARLAACVNIVGEVRSIYTWKGEVCDDAESLLVIKTRASLFEALREKVVDLHPYDVPEVIALPIDKGHPEYLAWIEESTG